MKEFERELLGGLLCTGKRVVDQFLIAQGDGDLGETVAHPDESGDDQTIKPERSTEVRTWLPDVCERFLVSISFLLTCIAKAKIAAVRLCEDQLMSV